MHYDQDSQETNKYVPYDPEKSESNSHIDFIPIETKELTYEKYFQSETNISNNLTIQCEDPYEFQDDENEKEKFLSQMNEFLIFKRAREEKTDPYLDKQTNDTF